MKRANQTILLALLVSLSASAQEGGPRTSQVAASPRKIASPTIVDSGPSLSSNDSSSSTSVAGQQKKPPQQQNPKPPKPAKRSGAEIPRPPIEGSMVGYIENAITGSHIRVRADAAFGDNRPDRAEFFYAQCGCNSATAPGPGRPGHGLVTNLNYQDLRMYGEFAPIRRFSVFAEVPVRWIQVWHWATPRPNFPDQGGAGDFQAGFKFAMLARNSQYFTFKFQAYFPTGDASNGLGTHHYSVEPALLYFQKLSQRLSLETQVGDWHPIDGSLAGSQEFAGDVFYYGTGPSYKLYQSERVTFAPVIELVGWRVLGGLETNGALLPNNPVVDASGMNIVNLKAGARTTIRVHHSFYIGFGQALTQERWYRHLVRFEYRFSL